MHLVKTALKNTTLQQSENLFLGLWCRNSDLHKKETTTTTMEYHWLDRNKLATDFSYLKEVYQRYLKDVSKILNNQHKINFSIKSWEILIGPWLRFFIEIVFDRHASIKKALTEYKVSSTSEVKFTRDSFISKDYNEFIFLITTDEWNQYLLDSIFQMVAHKKIAIKSVKPLNKPKSFKRRKITAFKKLAASLFSIFKICRPNICVTNSYFSFKFLMKLLISLEPPFILTERPLLFKKKIANNTREKISTLLSSGRNEFELILDQLIFQNIPTSYLENFIDLKKRANEVIPHSVSKFISGGSFYSDEILKMKVAYKLSIAETEIRIFQHGGSYGSVLLSNTEEHQLSISNYFYSWGWGSKKEKIRIMPSIKLSQIKKYKKKGKKKGVLLVLNSMARYSGWLYSAPFSSCFDKYLNDQQIFLQELNEEVRNSILIRLYQKDYGRNIKKIFEDMGLSHNIDEGLKSLEFSMETAAITINTFNTTTFLESLVMGVPSICFWNPYYNELRKNAEDDFQKLFEIELLHYSPLSAAKKVNSIFSNPYEWWESSKVKKTRDFFCQKYAHSSVEWENEWIKEMQTMKEKNL